MGRRIGAGRHIVVSSDIKPLAASAAGEFVRYAIESFAMDKPSPKIAPASLLHRLLGLTPGHAPTWICSRNSCEGLDLLIFVEVIAIFGACLLGQFHGLWWLLAVVVPAVIFFWLYLHQPFANRERWGRARRRRDECVWCGKENVEAGNGGCDCEGAAAKSNSPGHGVV
jgi:hypothetical protein